MIVKCSYELPIRLETDLSFAFVIMIIDVYEFMHCLIVGFVMPNLLCALRYIMPRLETTNNYLT